MFPQIPDLFQGIQAALSALIGGITSALYSIIALVSANILFVLYGFAGIAVIWLIYLLISRLLGFQRR